MNIVFSKCFGEYSCMDYDYHIGDEVLIGRIHKCEEIPGEGKYWHFTSRMDRRLTCKQLDLISKKLSELNKGE